MTQQITVLTSSARPPAPATIESLSAKMDAQTQLINYLVQQNAALTKQLGDDMTFIKAAAAATRLSLLTSQQTGNTLAAPLTVPAANIDQEVIHRTLSAAATDYLFTANQAGRNVVMAFSNDNGSTANMTISAQNSETISGPISMLNPTAPAQTYILQPGESLTLENTGTAAWTEVV